MKRSRMTTGQNSAVRTFHKWLGLSIASYLVFQSVTGLLLLYRNDIESLTFQPTVVERDSSTSISVQTIINNLELRYPSHTIDRIYFPAAEREPYAAHLLSSGGKSLLVVESDSLSGIVYGPRTTTKFLKLVLDLHHTLSLGNSGAYIVGATGLLLAASSVTGFWLWWPGIRKISKALRVKLSAGGVRAIFDLHRTVGSIVFIFIFVTSMTGFALAYGAQLRLLIDTKIGPTTAMSLGQNRRALSADHLIEIANKAIPDARVRDVRFSQPGNLLTTVVFFRDTKSGAGPYHRVWVDPYTGGVRGSSDSRDLDAGNTLIGWMYPIHTELGSGSVGRLLITSGGIGILFLSVTGPLLWWRKRKNYARRIKSNRTV